MSIDSCLRLGVYPSLAEHPLARLQAAGVAVTVNSDDRAELDALKAIHLRS